MTQPASPKIEFPCPNYPLKILGYKRPEFEGACLSVLEIHAPDFDATKISFRDSKNGRFVSMSVAITATGAAQLQQIFEDLKATGHVVTVL